MIERIQDGARTVREHGRALAGRGRTTLNDVFRVLEDLYLSEAARGQRLRAFWNAADAIEVLPNRRLIERSPEIVAYCTREALGEIGKAASDGSRDAWRQLSREAVAASQRYRAAAELPGGDPKSALDGLLAAIEDLDQFHKSESDANARAIHNLVFQVTGARLVGPDDAARQFSKLLGQLNGIAHGSGSWDEVSALRSDAAKLLRRLFSPPDSHLVVLETLAAITDPTDADVVTLEVEISNQHHVRYFLERIPSCAWLDRLGPHAMLAPPATGEPWPVGHPAQRLGSVCPAEFAAWLTVAASAWGAQASAAAHIGSAALPTGEHSHALLLFLLRLHPKDEGMRRVVSRAVLGADPTTDFVADASEMLLE
jgi:hypothetical protein